LLLLKTSPTLLPAPLPFSTPSLPKVCYWGSPQPRRAFPKNKRKDAFFASLTLPPPLLSHPQWLACSRLLRPTSSGLLFNRPYEHFHVSSPSFLLLLPWIPTALLFSSPYALNFFFSMSWPSWRPPWPHKLSCGPFHSFLFFHLSLFSIFFPFYTFRHSCPLSLPMPLIPII